MDQKELKLRTLLIDIGNKLSVNDRAQLSFILAADVPRRDLDTMAQDSRASMSIIWDALISRQKIAADNVSYLINCFEKIGRMDIARQLRQYSTASNQVEQPSNSSFLFARIDP